MKIGIEAQRIFREKRFGMDVVSIELIKQLQIIDQENEYFIFVRPGENKKGIDFSKPNFHFVEFTAMTYIDWEQIFLPHYAKKYKLDILHLTNNTAPIFCKTPMVLTLHDIIFFESFDLFKSNTSFYQNWGNFYRKIIVPRIIYNMREVITVSNFEKNVIENKFNLKDKKVKRIYNGVSEIFFQPVSEDRIAQLNEKYNIKNDYFVFLGNLNPKKNLVGVLSAFHKFKQTDNKNIRLVITNLDHSSLQKISGELLISEVVKDIILTDYLDSSEMSVLLKSTLALLNPSLRESFGIPVLEGFASEVPVITSKITSLHEISQGAAIEVDPYNFNEIAEAMTSVATDEKLRHELIEKGARRVKDFSWYSTAQEYLEIYKSIGSQKK